MTTPPKNVTKKIVDGSMPPPTEAGARLRKAKLHTRPSARESDGRSLTLTQASEPPLQTASDPTGSGKLMGICRRGKLV